MRLQRRQGLNEAPVIRHAEAALAARRELGDRQAIAMASAWHARAIRWASADPNRALELLLRAWEEFADLEETPAGVALMGAIVNAYGGLDRETEYMAWLDRLLPIAEELDVFDEVVSALMGRGSVLAATGRYRGGPPAPSGVRTGWRSPTGSTTASAPGERCSRSTSNGASRRLGSSSPATAWTSRASSARAATASTWSGMESSARFASVTGTGRRPCSRSGSPTTRPRASSRNSSSTAQS